MGDMALAQRQASDWASACLPASSSDFRQRPEAGRLEVRAPPPGPACAKDPQKRTTGAGRHATEPLSLEHRPCQGGEQVPQVQVVRRCHALQDLTEEENTMPDLPDLVIEYSIDGGVTWLYGKTVEARVAADPAALAAHRGIICTLARRRHGGVAGVATRVLPEGGPRARVNRPGRARPRAVLNRPGPEPGGTITVTRGQLLSALSDAGLIAPGTGTGSDVWDTLARPGRGSALGRRGASPADRAAG